MSKFTELELRELHIDSLQAENDKLREFVKKIEGITKYVSQPSVPKPQVYRRLMLALRDLEEELLK
jgi:hypothetical protein